MIRYEPWVGGAEPGLTPAGGTVTRWDFFADHDYDRQLDRPGRPVSRGNDVGQ
jgi:hypothetical protein